MLQAISTLDRSRDNKQSPKIFTQSVCLDIPNFYRWPLIHKTFLIYISINIFNYFDTKIFNFYIYYK